MNAIHLHRLGNRLFRWRIPLIPRLVDGVIFLLYNSYIPSSASIGRGTVFGYKGMGVVIHRKAIIGENCVISQQVTIGGKAGTTAPPRIGNRVYIAAGAKIIGDIKIGDDSVVGANSVVLEDVPCNTVVAGVPSRIIKTGISIRDYM